MRLLDTCSGRFVEKDPREEGCEYAILSHTWDTDVEQTYQELKKIQESHANEWLILGDNGFEDLLQLLNAIIWDDPNGGLHALLPLSSIWDDPKLSPKIRDACAVAREDGYRYLWIDSCCIDKTSSAELSEAINSMFAWYQWADMCYAYLATVPPLSIEDPQGESSAFRGSRWFKRGWTLQELLAPHILIFLSEDWKPLGSKGEFAELVNAITGISVDAQCNQRSLSEFSVAERLSWASNRETTRVEDRSYSLLGIFDINMPTLYGEGERAFQRLQEEILRRIPDQSIFAFSDSSFKPHIMSVDNLDPGLQLSFYDESQGEPVYKFMSIFGVDRWEPNSLLSTSPDNFLSARQVPLDQLIYYFPDLPPLDYIVTPHGIRMHIPLIPLSVFQSDIPIKYKDQGSEEKSAWYLAVLGCEHADYPDRLLARLCRLTPSKSGINFLTRGSTYQCHSKTPELSWEEQSYMSSTGNSNCFFALSAEVLAQSAPSAKVLPIYISLSSQRHNHSPRRTIQLMLKDGFSKSSGSTSQQNGVGDKPGTILNFRYQVTSNTYWLTLSPLVSQGTSDSDIRDIITIKYWNTTLVNLYNGMRLTINAHVGGTLGGHPIIPLDPIAWTDEIPWGWLFNSKKTIVLDNGKGGMAKVELSLEYTAPNHYLLGAHTTWVYRGPRLEPEDGNTKAPVPSLEDRAPGDLDHRFGEAAKDCSVAPDDVGAKHSQVDVEEGLSRMNVELADYRKIRVVKLV